MLKAIRQYNKERGAFSTLAYNCIRWEILFYIKQCNEHIVMVDRYYTKKDELWEYLPDGLTKKEKTILQLKLAGYTFKEIGLYLKHSRGWIYQLYTKLVSKIQNANT